MKVLVVNPPRFQGIPVIREDRCENVDRNCVQPPTSYVYMVSILAEKGHAVNLIDCNAYNIDYQKLNLMLLKLGRVEIVIFRSTPSTFFHDYKVAELVKKHNPDTLIVMLNWNLNGFPRQVMERSPKLDVYVHNYSYENILEQIVKGSFNSIKGITYRDGKEIVVNPATKIEKVGDIPKPLWGLLPDHSIFYTRVKSISPWGVIRGSKGCGFQCQFCVDHNIPFDPRTPCLVVDEVEDLVRNHGVKFLSFFDNTFTVNKRWVEEICSEIIDRNIKVRFFINTRVDLLDEDLLGLMKHAGLDGVSFGVEAGTNEMLESMRKGHSVDDSIRTIAMIKKLDVKVYLSLMMGYANETREQMEATRDLILKTSPHGFQLSITIPFPNTPLYDESMAKGLMDNGVAWSEMSVIPLSMSGHINLSKLDNFDLKELRKKFYRTIYFHPSFWMPNLLWVLRHPLDLKMGLQYSMANITRLVQGAICSH